MHEIKIGTIVNGENSPYVMENIKQYGFECFEINFWKTAMACDMQKLAHDTARALDGTDIKISCIGVYGNALMDDAEGIAAKDSWYKLIDSAHLFHTDLVCGFTGSVRGLCVPESMPKFREVYSEMAKYAAQKGVKLVFENCRMGGNWQAATTNLAFCPKAWELMFNEVPDENLGLQWEPCHQIMQFIDPIPQLRKWVKKVFNIHGKDASVAWDIICEQGISSGEAYAWNKVPGFGQTDWREIFAILALNGYKGNIDIEGFHDPVFKGELEYTSQVSGLKYLKECRGGEYIPNP